jgi:glycosyltransferase involved in cell wall biosynthesis
MKALLAFDHRFFDDGNSVRTIASFPASYWERYLEVFDDLVVLGRRVDSAQQVDVRKLNVSSRAGVRFEFVPDISTFSGMLHYAEISRKVRLLTEEADTIITRLPSELGLLAIAEARRQNKPWAVEVVGCAWDGFWHHGRLTGKLYAPIMMARTRRAVAAAPFALYVTREFLQRRYPCKRGTTVSCSNVEIPPPSVSVLNQRLQRLLTNPTPMILGLIGSLRSRYKGVQTVMEALANTRSQLPPIEFRILGGGDLTPWQDEARRFGVDDLVRFEGTLPSGDPISRWLDEIDLYLQPSLTEGLPRALVEAMSRGCPAIASDVGGIPELLPSELLIRPGDARRLGELLTMATTDTEWRALQAKRNWEVAREYASDKLSLQRSLFWKTVASFHPQHLLGPKDSL